ncbi:ComEA family DNA-binding protein [Geotoga petraea]|jgi:competence protein ComEA|uniref:Competence protein ComEA n=1 Tax=Geotoga petraea TaxID=28234 RepID=A0A1G6IEX0_9BACT|nr:helix-hairpin-helix domain-containing protein [Geotoga petraea]SDC04960.1 competence protein ComEA [Geotoga petraea]
MKLKMLFSLLFIIVVFAIGFTIKEKNNLVFESSIVKVDLINCTVYDLVNIPGIGEAKAKNIIDYRNKYNFTKKEDVMKVSGIGKATYNKIKNYIYVSEKIIKLNDEKINVNKATISELESLPGIGKTTAEKIVNYRLYKKIENFEDLYNIGLKRTILSNLEGMIDF